jgi:hypothetical protein
MYYFILDNNCLFQFETTARQKNPDHAPIFATDQYFLDSDKMRVATVCIC